MSHILQHTRCRQVEELVVALDCLWLEDCCEEDAKRSKRPLTELAYARHY